MNNVSIIGRITRDIELRSTNSGLSAVSMFIAVNNGKDQDGNERQADFPKVYVYDRQAENVAQYCHKGSLVGITGRIKTRTWDKEDGTKGYETYVLASRVQFLDTKQGDGMGIPATDYKISEPKNDDPFSDFGSTVEIDDNFLD